MARITDYPAKASPVGTDLLLIVDVEDTTESPNGSVKHTTISALPGGGGGGAVSSVFGRAGAVVATTGDYTATQVGADAAGTSAAETTRAEAAEALLAPKASPALTGTPTAPTAAAATNNTQLATTAYADGAAATAQSNAETYANASFLPWSTYNTPGGVAGIGAGGTVAPAQLPAATTSVAGIIELDGTATDIQASPGTQAAGASGLAADAKHVHPQPAMFAPTGLTGATAATRYVGATAGNFPSSGTFAVGDFSIAQNGKLWICTAAGSPGTWVALSYLDATATDIQPLGTQAAGGTGKAADAGHVHPTTGMAPLASPAFTGSPTGPNYTATNYLQAPQVIVSGQTGATAASRYVGATASGAPTSGTFTVGNFIIDQTGAVWVCTVLGTPGTWVQAGSALVATETTRAEAAEALALPKAGGTMTGWLAPAVATLTFVAAGTTLVNAALGNAFNLTLTASTTTLGAPSNPVDGQVIRIRVTQGTGGSFTLAYNAIYDFGAGSAPTLSTTAAKVDILAFEYIGSISKWAYLGSGLGY